MNYEIPREAFKQRLEDRLNFVFVDLVPSGKSASKFENVESIPYDSEFKTKFSSKFTNKAQNIILYSLEKGDSNPQKASQDLTDLGYNFVYYYQGTPADVVLDKGLN
jgi:hypothetical protein